MLVAVVLGGCGGGGEAAEHTERFTQGGVSMEPTVMHGQVVTVRKVDGGYAPRRGDVVLFRGAGAQWVASSAPLLKRVVAIGGETVACCDQAGRVTVDGSPLDESYLGENSPLDVAPNPRSCGSRRFAPVAVPADAIFVMGDNRARSNDSRCAGPVPVASVSGVMTGG
ncbi:hypothetical protein GCM10007977_052090 [Dactylosporangium sucinum]|uniref:Signal peptidase I n=2 Tax=Dactylosporangium sucinum TaxID=1424081 RepID=A0A917U0F4_9ACTN|nr:hypothetical protein GCM10007977_052090 [Dactylosporangium sucinum]